MPKTEVSLLSVSRGALTIALVHKTRKRSSRNVEDAILWLIKSPEWKPGQTKFSNESEIMVLEKLNLHVSSTCSMGGLVDYSVLVEHKRTQVHRKHSISN